MRPPLLRLTLLDSRDWLVGFGRQGLGAGGLDECGGLGWVIVAGLGDDGWVG